MLQVADSRNVKKLKQKKPWVIYVKNVGMKNIVQTVDRKRVKYYEKK